MEYQWQKVMLADGSKIQQGKVNEKNNVYILLYIIIVTILTGCVESNDSDSPQSSVDPVNNVSTDFPYLITSPRVTSIQNIYDTTRYDVTVEVDATGPTPIYSIDLWIYSKDDQEVFEYLELQYAGGTTWSATTNIWIPKPAGNYYIDSITIEDGDPFVDDLVKSSWYMTNGIFSSSNYVIDQRLTDWNSMSLLKQNTGVSNIPIVNFSLP